MRTLLAVSILALTSCVTSCVTPAGGDGESSPDAPGLLPETTESSGYFGSCAWPPPAIEDSFATFDALTSPPAPGQPASVVLGPWLDYLATDVVFEVGNDPPRVGRQAVADYFAPLLPVLGSVVHDLDTVSPVCYEPRTWTIRGTLLLTRLSDGEPVQPIRFTDTFVFNYYGKIARYEIRFDPTPIGELFVP